MSETGRPPRTFDSLRSSAPKPNIEKQQLMAACARIFAMPEGQMLLAWLENISDGLVLGPDASDGALRMHEGKRQLVHAIKELASGGRRPSES